MDHAGRRQLSPRQGAADALPMPDQSADLVLFVFSLHHVPGRQAQWAMAEARRVLRPSGRLYVAEPLAKAHINPSWNYFTTRLRAKSRRDGAHHFAKPLFRNGPDLRLHRRAKLCRLRRISPGHDRQHAFLTATPRKLCLAPAVRHRFAETPLTTENSISRSASTTSVPEPSHRRFSAVRLYLPVATCR